MSDVARLRQQIEEECAGMQRAMTGFAAVASHATIQQRYKNIGDAQEQLAQLIGDDEATRIVCEAYIQEMG